MSTPYEMMERIRELEAECEGLRKDAVQDQPGSGMAETAANRQETVAHAQRDPGREMAGSAAPEGWKMVPLEVTDEMAAAFMDGGEYPEDRDLKPWANGCSEWYGDRVRFSKDYAAMLAAAPASPKQETP